MVLKTVLVKTPKYVAQRNKETVNEFLKEALRKLCSCINADFNGDNGDEYISEEAKNNNFENDLEYAFVRYSNQSNNHFVESVIYDMCHGSEYEYDIVYNEDGFICAISICVVWN